MGKNVVADFTAFLSVAVDDSQVFETQDGRIVMTRDDIVFAGESEKQRLPLSALREFDFRTVPDNWEQFFDDLVGVRFETDSEETTVTIGTDTTHADQFVTVVLKLVLADTTAQVRQRLFPLDASESDLLDDETSFTLLPKSERVRFEDCDAEPIDISTITRVTATERDAVVVRHLCADGRVSTEITPDSPRGSQFLQTYLDFRSELATGAGPARFLFVGEDRDTLVLVAKLLKHRNLSFEAGHATSSEEVFEALQSAEMEMECLVAESELSDATGDELREQLREEGYGGPIVFLTRESHEDVELTDRKGVVDVVEIGSRTEHYEDVADAIERAVVAARVK